MEIVEESEDIKQLEEIERQLIKIKENIIEKNAITKLIDETLITCDKEFFGFTIKGEPWNEFTKLKDYVVRQVIVSYYYNGKEIDINLYRVYEKIIGVYGFITYEKTDKVICERKYFTNWENVFTTKMYKFQNRSIEEITEFPKDCYLVYYNMSNFCDDKIICDTHFHEHFKPWFFNQFHNYTSFQAFEITNELKLRTLCVYKRGDTYYFEFEKK